MDTFPDLGSLSDQELKDLIQQLTEEEVDISYKRRILHGKIDILRAELVNRLRKKHEGGEAGGPPPGPGLLPGRRPGLARPGAARPPGRRPLPRRPGLAQRLLRQPPADRVAPPRGRRRAPDRQVQAHLPAAVTMADIE